VGLQLPSLSSCVRLGSALYLALPPLEMMQAFLLCGKCLTASPPFPFYPFLFFSLHSHHSLYCQASRPALDLFAFYGTRGDSVLTTNVRDSLFESRTFAAFFFEGVEISAFLFLPSLYFCLLFSTTPQTSPVFDGTASRACHLSADLPRLLFLSWFSLLLCVQGLVDAMMFFFPHAGPLFWGPSPPCFSNVSF